MEGSSKEVPSTLSEVDNSASTGVDSSEDVLVVTSKDVTVLESLGKEESNGGDDISNIGLPSWSWILSTSSTKILGSLFKSNFSLILLILPMMSGSF